MHWNVLWNNNGDWLYGSCIDNDSWCYGMLK